MGGRPSAWTIYSTRIAIVIGPTPPRTGLIIAAHAPDGRPIGRLTWECVVLGAVGVIHERLVANPAYPLTNLVDPLTNMALLMT